MIEVFLHGMGSQGQYVNEEVDWPEGMRLPVAGERIAVGTRNVIVDRVDFAVMEGKVVKKVNVRVRFDE